MNAIETIRPTDGGIDQDVFSEFIESSYERVWRDFYNAKDRIVTVFQNVIKFTENTFWYLSFIRRLFEASLTLLSRQLDLPPVVIRLFKGSKLISSGRKFFYIPLIVSSFYDVFRLQSLKERVSALWKVTYGVKKVGSAFLVYSRMLKDIEQIIPFIFCWRTPLQYSMLPLRFSFLLRQIWTLYQVHEQTKEVARLRMQVNEDIDEARIKNIVIEYLIKGVEFLPKASKSEYDKIRSILENFVDNKTTRKDMGVLLSFCESHLLSRQYLLLLACIRKVLLLTRSFLQISETNPKMLLATITLLECGLSLLREFFKCYDRCTSSQY